jgi:hypothetical protein
MGSFYAIVLKKFKNENFLELSNAHILQNICSKSYGRIFSVNNFLNIFLK